MDWATDIIHELLAKGQYEAANKCCVETASQAKRYLKGDALTVALQDVAVLQSMVAHSIAH